MTLTAAKAGTVKLRDDLVSFLDACAKEEPELADTMFFFDVVCALFLTFLINHLRETSHADLKVLRTTRSTMTTQISSG